MALTKAAVTVLASTSNSTYSSTKASPGITGSSVDCRAYYDGELTWKITNGTAPGVALSLTFQASHDGTNWYDYYTVAGDVTASSVNSGAIKLDKGVMYLRAIAYAYTTNPVTVEAYLQAVTAL
jgi:hypothetical protein